MDAWVLAALGGAAVVASFIDSQVGGGGVISLPALVIAGVPPHFALGTNKLAGTTSSLIASANYARKGWVPWKVALPLCVLSFLAAFAGVDLALATPGTWILGIVLTLMVAMAAYVLLRPKFGQADRARAVDDGELFWMAIACIAIGFYDGFLGPGTGSFLLFAIVTLLGFGFRKAAALGRVLNLASNASALLLFYWRGAIWWDAGIAMAAGMAVGAWLGSHTALKHGDRYLKPLFVVITLALMVRVALLL